MRISPIVFAACALGGCQKTDTTPLPQTDQQRMEKEYEAWAARQPRPTNQLVDRIETLLAREPCIGSLAGLVRFYGYNRLPEKTVDTGIVDFDLREAQVGEEKAGRHITEPDSWLSVDDRPIKVAFGDYDVKENRIRISFCGKNFGRPQSGAINNMDTYYRELKQRRASHAS